MPSEFSPEELRAAREARERRSQVSDDMPGFLEEPLPQPETPRKKGGAVKIASLVVSLLTLAGFAAIVSYAYLWGLGDVSEGQIPIVAAAAEPEKVRPEEPGGMQVPHQETLVLNDGGGEENVKVERLLPPPEQPEALEPGAVKNPAESAPVPPVENAGIQAEAIAPGQASSEEQPGRPLALVPASKEADTEITAAPDNAPASTPKTDGAAASSQSETAPTPTPPVQVSKLANQNEVEAATEADRTEDAADTTETTGAVSKAASAPSPTSTQLALKPGDYVIQMAAFRSEQQAQTGWRDLQAKHPEELGDMNLLIQQVDIEGKGKFYRVQTGPFPNKATAEDMCAQLKARGQACIVTRR